MSSFSANRKGRPRPSNMSFGRRRSEDKSMPSPSFNSSMSLGHVEDVFVDTSRSVDRLRHHYLAMPATPSSLSAGSSPCGRTERLPSLTDLFHRDILSPPSTGLVPLTSTRYDQRSEVMLRSGSMSSASSGRGRQWNASFSLEGQPGSIGPPATPLSPYFTTKSSARFASPAASSESDRCFPANDDGESTPRATTRPSFDFTLPSSSNGSSPRCPGAPLIGTQICGRFETQAWQHQDSAASLGMSVPMQRHGSYATGSSAQLSAEVLAREKAAMSRLDAGLPKLPGLSGLGIYMDEDNIQSPFRKAHTATGRATTQATSPTDLHRVGTKHTGLTPMVKASKVSESTSTPTRRHGKKSPRPLSTMSPETNGSGGRTSPSTTAAKKRNDVCKTPLNKSRPMFRLDTGSGKKSSKPKGHKMSPNASPWGVFGVKDGWKPLAPPNVSRAIAEANKLVMEDGVRTSPSGKRQAHSTSAVVSPSKRFRATGSDAQLSPYKENMARSVQNVSPSKRTQVLSSSHPKSSTALPLSTVR